MSPSFPEIINSRVFKFRVGESKDGTPTEFSVHEEAIAQLSQPLHSLLKGELLEAQTGCAVWPSTSKEAFERFIQFAYTGDYSIPETKPCTRMAESGTGSPPGQFLSGFSGGSKENGDTVEKTAEMYDSFEELMSSFKGKKDKKGKKMAKKETRGWGTYEPVEPQPEPEPEPYLMPVFRTGRDSYPDPPLPLSPRTLTVEFRSLSFPPPASRNIHHLTCEPAEIFEPGRSYSNVFLAHAALYILGDFWLVDNLKALALHKLHKTLCIFQLNDENMMDIVDLARYAYREEGKGMEAGIGSLRSLVCQHMAWNAEVLSLHTGFMDFFAEGGQFVRDFFRFAVQRMQ
ncbi:hypothetical protein VTL71DRAFT_7579 [Oculimacula yallundae]|uniref:BTB domain-containing protein n=1 Tax=Oculimacula yallundae TaxID=86028 RepID=A0ABR4BW20_9HELO